MRTGSLRLRVAVATLALLAVVLGVVVTTVTLAYRSSLQRDLRHRLTNAGSAVQRAGTGTSAKALVQGLALEGIATQISSATPPLPLGKGGPSTPAPVKTGEAISSHGSLLVLEEHLPDGALVRFSTSERGINHDVRRLLVVELVVAAVALLVAALLVLQLTKAALRPLALMIETAARIASGSRLLRLQPTRTDTELGQMAATFDRMVDALEAAAANAESAEAAMRRFLADASHELRTPVAALQASAESLLRRQPERPLRDELEASLAGDAARLGRLIDDLLNVARLESSPPPTSEPVDLTQLVRAQVEQARRGQSTPTINLEAEPVFVRGEASGLERILRNLIDNALAATPLEGEIRIGVASSNGTARVSVSDTGPGIPEEERERVFERFVRFSNGHAGGSGLGLAIARRIARQHGGDLTCDPVPHGAAFTLRLPADTAQVSWLSAMTWRERAPTTHGTSTVPDDQRFRA
jgi:two-component system, OmpR family, sensor kinase